MRHRGFVHSLQSLFQLAQFHVAIGDTFVEADMNENQYHPVNMFNAVATQPKQDTRNVSGNEHKRPQV